MAQWIEQGQSITVKIGPFVDATDGNTAEIGLTLTQPDIRLSKNGGAFAQKSAAQTLSHDENGYYGLSLSATDTGTLGRLTVHVKEAGALPVWHEFMVVTTNTWDSLFGSDYLQTDMMQCGSANVGVGAIPSVAAGATGGLVKGDGSVTFTAGVGNRLSVDTTALGGTVQSAADLKDFADAGYDPGTNKVQGVVLVDTTTVNSDMVGTNSAALASVCTEARLSELDAVTGGKMANQVDVIESDTTSLNDTKIPDIISLANINAQVDSAIETYKLDHLVAVADSDDAVDNSLIAKLASKAATANWSDFDNTTDSLEAISDAVAPSVPQVFSGTATNSSTSSKVYVQAGDPPSGAADDDYNDMMFIVWYGTDKATARVAVRAVTDYDDSDPSFTLDSALPFTPTTNHIVEVYAADTASLAALTKLSTGFGSTSPDTLNAYLLALMSKAASAPALAGTFDPATDSVEVLRERVDLIEGSGFATGTDSLKQIRDAIDTLVAPAVVTSTSMSGSGFLSDAVTLVRRLADEPSTTPKYTNTVVVEFLQAAFSTVLAEININTDHPVVVRHDITLVSGTLDYLLPPQVGEIWRVAKIISGGYVPIYEVWPDGHHSSHQSGFVVEGNIFRLLNDWKSTDTLQVLFVALGEPFLHYGTAGAVTSTSIILASSPTDGTLDTRANSYAGYLLRVLESTEGYIQERSITAYDNTTRTATISPAFDPELTGTIKYEVLPTYSDLLKHVVCMQAALDILGIEGNKTKMQTLGQRFVVKMRALKLLIGKKSSRFPGHMDGDTSDNDARGDYYGWLA